MSRRYNTSVRVLFVFLGRGSSWYHRRLRTVFHRQEPVISRYGCHYRRNNVFLCGVATFLACTAPLWCSSLHGHLPTAPQNTTRGRVAKVNTLTSSENKERLDSGTPLWSPLCQANVGRSPNVSRCLSPPCWQFACVEWEKASSEAYKDNTWQEVSHLRYTIINVCMAEILLVWWCMQVKCDHY